MTRAMFPAVLDSSIIASFKSCPAKCFLANFEDWKPRVPSVHLHAGAAFARGLEVARRAFYEAGTDAASAEALGLQALLEFYGDFAPPSYGSGANKSAERMAGALEFYFSRYPLNHQAAYPVTMPGGRKGIEFSFLHPLPIAHPDTGEPLQYCGRADGIFHYAGDIYVFDEKTTTRLGEQWAKQWKLRSQFTGYAWAAAQSGIHVNGVVVRGVSILKSSYDTLEDISFRSEHLITRWYGELLTWIEQMITCYRSRSWPHNFDSSCSDYGGCEFLSVCDTENPDDWLERSHERRHWDPVSRTETKLLENGNEGIAAILRGRRCA